MDQLDIFEKPGEIRYHVNPQINSKDLYHLIRSEILSLNVHPDDLVILAPTYETIRNLEYNFRHIAHGKTTHICETEEGASAFGRSTFLDNPHSMASRV